MVNIGDVFILKYDEKDKKNRCVYYRKKYTVTDLSTHLVNAYLEYSKKDRQLSKYTYLGYIEACLVNFGVIESKANGMIDYSKVIEYTNFFGRKKSYEESREQTLIRLTKEFLKENNLI